MTTLPVQLLKKLHRTLENCDPFKRDDTLHSLFIDPRISPWRRGLPQATDVQNRVNQMIAHLLPKYNANNKNALVLFLQLLAEWHDAQDRMRYTLQALATEVADALAALHPEPAHRPSSPVPPQPVDISLPKKWSWVWLLGGLALLVGLAVGWGLWTIKPTTVSELVDALPTATATSIPPTNISTATATSIPPTATPTSTGTNRPIPPTATPTVTNTPVPPIPRPTVPVGMVLVPAGVFTMGSQAEIGLTECEKFRDDCQRASYEHEEPVHRVYLDTFYIDRYEVTNSQFRACVEAEVCEAPITCDFGDPAYEDNDKANHPVVCVDWLQANTYCEFVGSVGVLTDTRI